MPLLNLVTAVTREYNLPRIMNNLCTVIVGSGFKIKWIQVFDVPGPKTWYGNALHGEGGDVRIQRVVFPGPPNLWAVLQKNLGMDQMEEGWYLCLDDDNVLHSAFLKTVGKAIAESPTKKAVVVSQRRWDKPFPVLEADTKMVKPGNIDSAQFMIHTSLIGKERYDPSKAGAEDGHFVTSIYKRAPDEFVFVKDVASYFNYLNVERGTP